MCQEKEVDICLSILRAVEWERVMIRVKGWNSSGVIVTPRARDLGFEPW
jgi:hypothetical protein